MKIASISIVCSKFLKGLAEFDADAVKHANDAMHAMKTALSKTDTAFDRCWKHSKLLQIFVQTIKISPFHQLFQNASSNFIDFEK